MTQGVTEFIDITSAGVYLEEIWSKRASVARNTKLVFAANVDTSFQAELKRGEILRIGRISDLTATDKTVNAAISYETTTESEDTLTIDTFKYAAFAIEDVVKPMVSLDLVNLYMPKIGYALAKAIDTEIAALIDDGIISNTVGTLATGLTYDNIVRADQYLNDGDTPDEDRAIIISNAEKANWLKMDQFINRDYADIRSGLLGSIFNYPIFVSNNTDGTNNAGHDSVMMHKSCIMLAIQIQPVIKTAWDIDYLCAKVCGLQTSGTDFNEAYASTHGVCMYGL